MKEIIQQTTVVNEGRSFVADVVIEDEIIKHIFEGEEKSRLKLEEEVRPDVITDGKGSILIPGVIDEHVHFREPGLTHKASIASESRKAVAGGVTTFMDMPNCIPQTTTLELLEQKYEIAAKCSPANYSFYLGATDENIAEIEALDARANCGVKVFMGSSTGGMLLDNDAMLENVFRHSSVPIALHCEDQRIISENIRIFKEKYGEDPDVRFHPLIRSEEACYRSSARAVELAERTGADIHILHISTKRELNLFQTGDIAHKHITAEACIAHLLYSDADYSTFGTAIKCNPAIKTAEDRDALRRAVRENVIDTIATDHAPHTPADKQGGALKAASGIAVLPHSLTAMLQLVKEGVFSIYDVVRTMCHNPALRYHISKRGFIREGYKADLVLLLPNEEKNHIISTVWVNGKQAYANGIVNENVRGQRLTFDR